MCLYSNFMWWEGSEKKVWLWDFLIKFSFGWLQNLILDTFGWMIEKSSHCSVIFSNDEINAKKSIIEWILYHLKNFISLYTFWDPLEVLWGIIFFLFLSSIFRSITLMEGLVIEDHSNDPLASPTNDEGIPARGFISPTRWYLLPAYIICNGNFNLVVIFYLVWQIAPVNIWLIVVF